MYILATVKNEQHKISMVTFAYKKLIDIYLTEK